MLGRLFGIGDKLIDTTRGKMPLSALRKVVSETEAPCGRFVQTTYYAGDEVVRQDQKCYMDKPFGAESGAGSVS